MHQATQAAQRVVAVLSPDYLHSDHGEAEWRPHYADDPAGDMGLILPVRVQGCEPQGLLKTRTYVDLVGKNAGDARLALVAAARGVRGKPETEPEYPGLPGSDLGGGTETPPRFPGQVDSASGTPSSLSVQMRADDGGALPSFFARAATSMRERGFTDREDLALNISVRELVDNAIKHVSATSQVHLELEHEKGQAYTFHDAVVVSVRDDGPGFDLDATLKAREGELARTGHEHGLLRAYRLGGLLNQEAGPPHELGWGCERCPSVEPLVFSADVMVPFVFSYRAQALRIGRELCTFWQFRQILERSPQFLDLIFDPLVRPNRSYLDIEVVGQGWTGSLPWKAVLTELHAFAERAQSFDKSIVLFADTGPSEQQRLREFSRSASIEMFEDEDDARAFVATLR